jgi:hypothetical protein
MPRSDWAPAKGVGVSQKKRHLGRKCPVATTPPAPGRNPPRSTIRPLTPRPPWCGSPRGAPLAGFRNQRSAVTPRSTWVELPGYAGPRRAGAAGGCCSLWRARRCSAACWATRSISYASRCSSGRHFDSARVRRRPPPSCSRRWPSPGTHGALGPLCGAAERIAPLVRSSWA